LSSLILDSDISLRPLLCRRNCAGSDIGEF